MAATKRQPIVFGDRRAVRGLHKNLFYGSHKVLDQYLGELFRPLDSLLGAKRKFLENSRGGKRSILLKG